MFRSLFPVGCVAAMLSAVSLCGCTDSAAVSPGALAQHRERLLMEDEPDGVQPVLEVREAMLGVEDEHDHEGHDDTAGHDAPKVDLPTEVIEVVLVGQIGGLTNPWKAAQPDFPFEKNQAKFFLADPGAVAGAEASGHNHAPGEECPICEANAKDTTELLAVVQFIDEKGNVLPIDARVLFDIKEKDTVVVRGKAHVTAGGILAVDATGVYVRR